MTMSDLETKQQGIRFEPVLEGAAKRTPPPTPFLDTPSAKLPGFWILVLGVILPAAVIVIEAGWRLCAENFFDPMPTIWHSLAIAFVPTTNLILWLRLRNRDLDAAATPRALTWLAFANGAAISIAAFYALIFAPLAPVAVLAIVFYGMGLLPLAPLASLVAAARLRHCFNKTQAFNKTEAAQPVRRPFFAGLVAGLALLLALDIPAAATRLGLQWATSTEPTQRQRGVSLLRTFGDDDLLLRLCYDAVGRPAGLLSALIMFGGNGFLDPQRRQLASSTAEVREIYYRVNGVPFNTRPAPFEKGKWARMGDFQFDADHGGTDVGGRIKGLSLVSSRMDGSVSGDDAVGYLEWTVEFRNTSPLDREARLQLALPPGGVVSRATLWVNGEEREAAYGGRAEVRAAYQKVAVQQRRDPLLVTTKGADRVLAQAFPVPRNGGTIKFKLGISAPLTLSSPEKAHLTLPAIVDRNFSFAADARHGVWIESKRPLSIATVGLSAQQVDPQRYRISGDISDRDLARNRPSLLVERAGQAGPLVAQLGDGDRVIQEIVTQRPDGASTLMLVVDGSARLKGSLSQLIMALDAIPPTAKVGLIVASEPIQSVAVAPWSPAQKQKLIQLLRGTSFAGGQDNAPALAEALRALEAEPKAKLLWVHGPQPMSFRGSAALLEQTALRLARVPETTLYSVEPGPNEVLPDTPWGWRARLLPKTATPSADLATYFARELGDAPVTTVRRGPTSPVDGLTPAAAKGSDHIARLWARDRVLELMSADAKTNRPAALALAVQHRLITPISGAVVLEAQQQYDEARLTPVSQATVPTVPEPHEWALLLMACAAMIWLMRRRREDVSPGFGAAA
jgi:Vault protein inter-alpha-trypsin domain